MTCPANHPKGAAHMSAKAIFIRKIPTLAALVFIIALAMFCSFASGSDVSVSSQQESAIEASQPPK
jgi:hypothetical protein